MLTIKDYTTDREHLTDLLSVATYGNYWPVVRAYKSDAEAGLFNDCDCYEDKLAVALLNGKGVVVYDHYVIEDAETEEERAEGRHPITLADVEKGLKLMQEQYPHDYADLMEEEDDAITGDVWLQLAVFGELIYG